MKILHYLYKDDFGGGPKGVWMISQHVSEDNKTYILTKGSGRLGQIAKAEQFKNLIKLPNTPNWLWFLDPFALTYMIWHLRPDIIFVHGQRAGLISAFSTLIGFKNKRIYIAHWISLYEPCGIFSRTLRFIAEKFTYKRHSKIVCLSEGNVRFLLLNGVVDDIYSLNVIPNANERTYEAAEKSSNIWKKKNSLRFLFMARLDVQKRVDWLLKSWHYAQQNGLIDAELLILGNGPLKSKLEKMTIDLDLTGSVSFGGYVDNPATLLGECDALLITSQYECHAYVTLEGLAAGVPIIAMDADGVKESFENMSEGIQVPIGDWIAFGDAICLLSRSPELREKFGINARQRIKMYDPSVIREKYRALIRH